MDAIRILKTENGYIVYEDQWLLRGESSIGPRKTWVFNNLHDLQKWMQKNIPIREVKNEPKT